MTSTNDTMLNAALGYLLQEKRPIPVRHKRARVEWAEFQDRPPTEAEVREWWNRWPDADIALVTGNGWAALDFDGDDGQSAIMERGFPDTPIVRTPHGFHSYHKADGRIHNAVRLAPGIDVRGDGGYVVAPPSPGYEWINSLEEFNLAPFPEWASDLYSAGKSNGNHLAGIIPDVIQEGMRDAMLASLAGTMRRRGVSESTIVVALLEENAARCVPPLDDEQVRKIASSISRYEPSINGLNTGGHNKYPLTDTGNAELLAHLYGNKIRYDHRQGRWLVGLDHWWGEDQDGELVRLAIEAARHRYHASEAIQDLKERAEAAKFAVGSENRQRLQATLSIAKSLSPIADNGDGWDSNPWTLGVANGVVDLKTGEFRDGKRGDRITRHSNVAFDHEADCPRWIQFLDETFGADVVLIDWIARVCGYSTTGLTSEQIILVLQGKGWNGKSTFLRAIREVLGGYGHNSPFSMWEAASRQSIPSDLADLEGKRLVTSSETQENARFNEARLKSIAGGDAISARHLYHEAFTFTPTCTLWLAVNRKPKVTDDSLGFWRKVRLIPFTESFEGRADQGLEEALRAEYPGILRWMVDGAIAWAERGLNPLPDRVSSATDDYRRESDPLGDFLESRCVMVDGANCKGSKLYGAYCDWAEEEGLRKGETLTNNAFGRIMRGRFHNKHSNTGTTYEEVGLRSEK